MLPVAENVPVAGLYKSALAKSPDGPNPPAISTVPFVKSVAVWDWRAAPKVPVGVDPPGTASVTLIVVVVVLPARSVADTTMEVKADESVREQEKLGPLSVAGIALHITPDTPESESVAVPVTVNADEVTVAPFVGLETFSTGGVRSRFTVTLAVAVRLAVSVTAPEIT